MKIKLHSTFTILAALALCLTARPVRAQDNTTISAADFQRMVYSAHLHTQLALKPELGACLQTLLEMQRRNPNANPMALADVSRQALQFYRTNEPVYIRTNGYPDEILAAYLDALRHIPAHTNFVPANLTLLNYFLLNAADHNYITNDTVLDLLNSANQRLSLSEENALKRQALADDCVARAQGNAAFGAAMDSLLLPETGVSLQDTPAEIIGNTNSPLHDDETMTNLLALSQASGNGSLTVSSNYLTTLYTTEIQTMWDTINTNLAVLAQINESQPDYLAYLTNQAAIDANNQLEAAVQQGQPARLASATAAALVCSQLSAGPTQTSLQKAGQWGKWVSAGGELAVGALLIYKGNVQGAGTLTAGISGIFGLVAGDPAQDTMATNLDNVKTMVGDLSHNVNYRFDRVDQSLTTIYSTMNQQFSNIDFSIGGLGQKIATLTGDVNDIRNSLVTVQSSLDRIEAEVFADAIVGQQDQIVGPIDNDLLYAVQYPATRGPFPEGDGSSGQNYKWDEGLFYKYALNDANDAISSTHSSLDLSASGLQQQLEARPLDANLNYIQQFLTSTLNVNTVGTPGSPFYLSNPQEWFIAADAYLQLAGENPMYFRKDASRGRVSDIISRGQNIANFCGSLTFNGANINSNLWNALENDYIADLTDFNGQVSLIETAYAKTNNLNLDTWRQWDAAAPRVTATATAVLTAPNYLDGQSNVVAIAAGYLHSLALKADGTVVGWGENDSGDITIPDGLTNVMAVAGGQSYSLALKADGTVVGWGDSSYGDITIPDGLTNVVAVAAGRFHTLALKADGTVIGWGYNPLGEATGTPNHVSPYISSGTVTNAGQPLTNVVAIAAGDEFSLALKADGTVVGWGDNSYGQTTIPAGLANVVAIAAGYTDFSLALKADGTVVGWGENIVGQTTIPTGLTNVVAIAACYGDGLALKADGTVVGWGTNVAKAGGTPIIPPGLTNVVAIAGGRYENLFLTATSTGGSAASGSLSFVRAELPDPLLLFQGCNQKTLGELADPLRELNKAAGKLSGAKMLLTDVLELGMPYTLAHDGVLHGFLYGSESLVDTGAATTFLQNQNVQLQVSPNAAAPALEDVAALRYLRFQDRLNQDLANLQATGQPEIPRLVGQTLRLLNLLSDAWTPPANSPAPALEISSQTNTPSLLLYGEPYMNYTLQYQDSLGAPGWTTTTLTNLQDGQAIIPPFSGSPQRFYRLMLPIP